MRINNPRSFKTAPTQTYTEQKRSALCTTFLMNLLVMVCLYFFTSHFLNILSRRFPQTATVISIPLIALVAIWSYALIRYVGMDLRSLHIIAPHPWRNAVQALYLTLPLVVLVFLIKYTWITFHPDVTSVKIFDGVGCPEHSSAMAYHWRLVLVAGYIFFAPVQEIISRGFLQGTLNRLLDNPHRTLWKIILPTILFSSFHLHTGFIVAILVLPPGLFWGWLCHRQKSIIGACVSHALLGSWTLSFIGIDTIILYYTQ